MNAGVALLVALAVHLGGVDLDSARDAALTWYRGGAPAPVYQLDSITPGSYAFTATDGALTVARLDRAELAYALLLREGDWPLPTGVGAVSLGEGIRVLGARGPGRRGSIDRAGALVAWVDRPTGDDGGSMDGESGMQNGSTISGPPAPTAPALAEPSIDGGADRITWTVQSGLVTVSHPASGVVVTLRLTP